MLIIGLAGKSGSGKSTLARHLAICYDGIVAPFAASLKGAVMWRLGGTSWHPQWDTESRKALQKCGMRGREIEPDLWIKVLSACFEDSEFKSIIIPDVRFENEVEFIHKRGGVVLYLVKGSKDNAQGVIYDHVSEQLDPSVCDLLVFAPEGDIARLFEEARDALASRGIHPTPRLPRVYVGGNILGDDDFSSKFSAIEKLLKDAGFDPIIPQDVKENSIYDELLRTYPFHEVARKIVVTDIKEIARADAGLFYLTQPSIGAAMEIVYCSLTEKPCAIVTTLPLRHHLWLNAHGTVFWQSVNGAIAWLKRQLLGEFEVHTHRGCLLWKKICGLS